MKINVKEQNKRKTWNQHTGLKPIIDKKDFIRLYYNEEKSINEICKLFNTDNETIERRMIIWGIKKRTRQEAVSISNKRRSDPESKTGNRKIYIRLAKKHKKWECEKCGSKETNKKFDLIVHHKDGNNKNNNLKNLQVLCQSCHAKTHRTGKKFAGGYKK